MTEPEEKFVLAIAFDEEAWGYWTFQVRTTIGNSSRWTNFETDEATINGFIGQLVSFHQTLTPDTELKYLYGETIYFALRFSRLDSLGNIGMECEINQPTGGGFDAFHIKGAVVSLSKVDELARYFQSVLTHGNRDPVYI